MCMRQICDDLVQVVCVEQVDVNGNWVMKLCVGRSIQVCCDVSPLPRNLAEFEFPRTALLRQVGLLHVRALDRAVFRLCTVRRFLGGSGCVVQHVVCRSEGNGEG